jgi:spore maturation protein CgeB
MGLAGRPSIAYQRKLILEKIGTDPRFLLGEVRQSQYNRELSRSKIVLSPFGWGELCIRDFEAVRAGALLMKPDMDHIETWPDIFVKDESYVSFSWDADDLMDGADRFLAGEKKRKEIARNAFESYRKQAAEMPGRFRGIIDDIERL